MNLLIGFILGALIGWYRASKRGGDTSDKLQYAFGHGVALLVIVLFGTIFAVQLGWFA